MTAVAVRTSRFPVFADVASAYSIAFVLQFYSGVRIFAPTGLDPITAQAVEVAVLGGLISSFLFFVDPVNKGVRLLLPFLLQKKDEKTSTRRKLVRYILFPLLLRKPDAKETWAKRLIERINLGAWVDHTRKDEYVLTKSKNAYWTPYLSKLRAQMSGGFIFLIVTFAFVPHELERRGVVAILTFAFFLLLFSLIRDLRFKVPAYCWIVAVYGLMVETKSRSDISNLNGITKHLLDSNWEEASWWLTYELMHEKEVAKESNV